MSNFKTWCIYQHDSVCNQKYGQNDELPYSFHLKAVFSQYEKFKYLLSTTLRYEREEVEQAVWGHDLIEDARLTYSDIKKRTSVQVADIIFSCTDSLGKTREERKDEAFWLRLTSNDLAIFVKLCDVIANTKYSLLTNSSMYETYRKEFPYFKKRAYREQYKEMFDYLEKLLSL
jgi:(p)ppGpp synthase/HD superfamily hydrolase